MREVVKGGGWEWRASERRGKEKRRRIGDERKQAARGRRGEYRGGWNIHK